MYSHKLANLILYLFNKDNIQARANSSSPQFITTQLLSSFMWFTKLRFLDVFVKKPIGLQDIFPTLFASISFLHETANTHHSARQCRSYYI